VAMFLFMIQKGETPLMAAAKGGHKGIVNMLIEAKLNVNDADDVRFILY